MHIHPIYQMTPIIISGRNEQGSNVRKSIRITEKNLNKKLLQESYFILDISHLQLWRSVIWNQILVGILLRFAYRRY